MTSLPCSSLFSMAYLGVNVAAFTEEPTLATAAWLDFKAHILRLLEAGLGKGVMGVGGGD